MHRILALFQEKETRDELGLGAIRDSLSDQFFPGTSTIQTRLRYFFFVPWVYQSLEEQRVPSHEIARRGRKLELRLTRPLLEAGDKSGVFGRMAGGSLKRLPSQVYWAGLGIWGIRRFDGTPLQYHWILGTVYRRRSATRRFVEGWLHLINDAREIASSIDLPEARALIQNRERQLKRARSRFVNKRALDQWSGRSGLIPLSYRWGNVRGQRRGGQRFGSERPT
ncbi:MAG: DUF6361 family protein [Acidobacteriota bacterium]